MNITIIGTGALGSLLLFYLSSVQTHTVWMLGSWAEHIAAIQSGGLVCLHGEQTEQRIVRVTTDPEQVGVCDIALVLVKSGQTARAIERIRPLMHASTLVITLQNGLGNYEKLTRAFGAEHVVQGVTMLGATMLQPGRIRHAGAGPTYFAGTDAQSARLTELVALFQAAGLLAEQRNDVETLIWGKLVINVGINGLTALLRIPNGALLERASAQALLTELVTEAVAVAHARGIALPGDPLAQVLAVARSTGANRSSMLQDVERGVPTEIAAINGAIVREGERLSIATPYNRAVTLLIEALEC